MAGRSQHLGQIMENQTRFDLNAAIENWRQELAAQSNLASDDRRELEMHLRDAIAGFQQRGLNDEESFWLARRRVGQPPQLGEEFVKANPSQVWRERVFWMTFAWLIIECWGTASFSIIRNIVALFRKLSANDVTITIQAISLLFFVFPILAVMLWLTRKRTSQGDSILTTVFQSRRRFAISVVLFVVFTTIFSTSIFILLFNMQRIHLMPIDITREWLTSLLNATRQLVLIPLLVWLMPNQNRISETTQV
jgi:hypothetical protein